MARSGVALLPIIRALTLLCYMARFGLKQTYRAFFRLLRRGQGHMLLRTFGFAGGHMLITKDERMTRAILTKPRQFERAPMPGYRPFNTRCVLGAGSGEDWRRYRRLFNDYFTTGFRADLPELEAIVAGRMAAWRIAGRVDLLRELFKIVVEIRGRLFFQHDFGCFDDGDDTFADIVSRLFEPPVYMLNQDPDELTQRFHAHIDAAIMAAHAPGSIGHTCRTLRERGELSAEEALQSASLFVLAQAPTFAVFWILYRCASMGRCADLRRDRTMLLQAIKEELRIHPPVTRLLTRVANQDTTLHDQHIPADTQVVMAPLFTHHAPALWEQPEQFRPERWQIRGEGATELLWARTDTKDQAGRPVCPHERERSVELKRPAPGAQSLRYLPFGAGRHQCQGRQFAVEEIVTIVETILRYVDLEVVEDHGLLARPIAEQIALNPYAAPIHGVVLGVHGR